MTARPAEDGPHIDLLLDDVLAPAVLADGVEALEHDVAGHVASVMTTFGIPGAPTARVSFRSSSRMVTVQARGANMRYPAAFLRRLWFTGAPERLRPLATVVGDAYPDRWMAACADVDGDPEAAPALVRLLGRLPADVLTLAPSALLTPAGVAILLGDDEADHEVAREILARLLDMDVAVPSEPLGPAIRDLLAAGMTPLDVVESLYDQQRRRSIDLCLDPQSFDELAPDTPDGRIKADHQRIDPELRAGLSVVLTDRLEQLGIRVPLVLARDAELGADEIRVRMDDRIGLPVPVPRRGEIAVTAPIAALASLGVEARPLVDAITGFEQTAVPRDAERVLVEAGFRPVSRWAYVAAALGRTVSVLAHRVFACADVEADLAAFEERCPSLVHEVLARHSIGELTRVLRDLSREQVSSRDLWQILNAILRHDLLPAPGRDLLATVREALGPRLAFDTGQMAVLGEAALAVYETDPAFESELVAAHASGSADEGARCRMRDRIWSALGAAPPPEPVLLTSAQVRSLLQKTIGEELPCARVLAHTEIPPGLEVRRLGWIAGAT
jgi:hypothetical protein